MRQLDNRNSWLDDKGQPLVGKVLFCRLHTTTPENVYNINGTVVLSNPMYTNNIGQLNTQVFLADKDYSVRFYKYVGTSSMEDDDNDSNWLFAYSCDNLYDTFSIEVESTNLQAINNITDLRNTDPSTVETKDNKKMVELLGYNAIGDKPTVRYVWNQNSVENDNGGSVIKVPSIATGRWELVNDFNYITGVDVRHFGVFGKDTLEEVEQTMPSKIDIANTYAYSIGMPLYFGSNGDLTWYKFNSNLNGSLFQKGSRMVATTDCTVTVSDENSYLDVYNDQDNTKVVTITGMVVKTSWGKNSTKCVFNPSKKLIIDETINTVNKIFENIDVDVLVQTSNCKFTNCVLNSNGKLALGNEFHQCVLKQYMFAYTFTATVFDDCVIDIDDWTNTSSWLYLVTQNTAKPLDFKGRSVDSTCEVGWGSCTYLNAYFNGFVCSQSNATFKDCSGTISFTNANPTIAANGCNLNCTMTGNQASLNVLDSTVSFNKNMTFNTLYATNSTLNDTSYSYTLGSLNGFSGCTINVALSGGAIVCDKCNIQKNITCTQPTISNSTINGVIYQSTFAAQLNFILLNNTWLQGSCHNLSAHTANTIVVGSWIGNSNLNNYHFITIDRTNINPSETAHSYVYENNTGKYTLQRLKASWQDEIYVYQDNPSPVQTRCVWHNDAGRIFFPGAMTTHTSTDPGTTNTDVYLTEFQMFTVGTQDIGFLNIKSILPQHTKQEYYLGTGWVPGEPASIPSLMNMECSVDEIERGWTTTVGVGSPKGIAFKENYTWRITSCENIFRVETAGGFFVSPGWKLPIKYEITNE